MHPAEHDDDPMRSLQMIDFLVIGVAAFARTMLFTVVPGCLIVASMKGPTQRADVFPGALADHDRH